MTDESVPVSNPRRPLWKWYVAFGLLVVLTACVLLHIFILDPYLDKRRLMSTIASANRIVVRTEHMRGRTLVKEQLTYDDENTLARIKEAIRAAPRDNTPYDTPVGLFVMDFYDGSRLLASAGTCSGLFYCQGNQYYDRSGCIISLVDVPMHAKIEKNFGKRVSPSKTVNRLRASVSVDQPAFEPDETIVVTIELQNIGGQPITLLGAGRNENWRVVFDPKGSGVSRRARSLKHVHPVDLTGALSVPSGKATRLCLGICPITWDYVDVQDDRQSVPYLPPGKYAVTASYEHAEHKQGKECPYWHGTLTTGAVEIEVKSKAQSKK